jgi:hypothetical protein
MEPSVDALSATITSASEGIEASSPGRNFSRYWTVFQFRMTTAVFME